tara:strand:- start:316 stop:612 length:297 start_codon:yes stop_codon:yes gene_type:complete
MTRSPRGFFKSKYNGYCRLCRKTIAISQEIEILDGKWVHATCGHNSLRVKNQTTNPPHYKTLGPGDRKHRSLDSIYGRKEHGADMIKKGYLKPDRGSK